MFIIRSISLTDFGPFKGEQRIDFPGESGVSIIYGENMRGKTTLLNAIRYALFGKVITRGATAVALHQIGNWESALEKSKFGFKVVLEFENEGSKYQLTRDHHPRPGIETPEIDADYQQDHYLQKDGIVLGPDECDNEISRIMPETVSRFFLFDGELLQQYEELLREESDMGRNIKDAIERILGVPVLTNGRMDLSEISKDAQKREAKAAQKNQATQSLGNQHEALLAQMDGLQIETDRLKKELENLRNNKISQEDLLRKTEKTRALLDERTNLQQQITNADSKIKEREDRKKTLLADSWKGLLNNRIRETLNSLERNLTASRESYQRVLVSEEMTAKFQEALGEGECSMCGQELSSSAKTHLTHAVSVQNNGESREILENRIQTLEIRLNGLKQSDAPSNANVLLEVQTHIDELKIEKAVAGDSLIDIKVQTQEIDGTDMRRISLDYERTLSDIGILQEGIKRQDESFRAINDNIRKIEIEMAKHSGTDLEIERTRKELCGKLTSLFAGAVDAYRDRLKEKVESDATALFLKLTSEPEYTALSINDNYGLTIVHEDGSSIPVRSAGAEHVVALSLMGALQRNAPLRGPIIMDSPFGRLDHAHTTKIIQALPSMADQVLLLVYESELEPNQARDQLEGKLRKEYRIVRRSARHSEIETIA